MKSIFYRSLVWQSQQSKATPAIFSKRWAVRPFVWHESNIKKCVTTGACFRCQIKNDKEKENATRRQKRGNERRKSRSEFLRGSGFGSDMLKHRLEPAKEVREHRVEKDEEDVEDEKEEEYRAPARDRLQHAGFDHMAPPGAGNTKPCDYPKHTGSDWVSEPALFPTRLLWTLWDVRLFYRVYGRPFPPPEP